MINIEDAYSYFNNERLFAEKWLEATSGQQEQSLNMATNQIKRLNLTKDIDFNNDDVARAICEQALYLIETQGSSRSKLIEQGVTSFSVEGLSESYDTSKIKSSAINKVCSEALAYLRPYLRGSYEIC